MKRQNQAGFAHLGAIGVVIIVIVAVAFGGWYVWNSNDKDTNNPTSQTEKNKSKNNPILPKVASIWSSRNGG